MDVKQIATLVNSVNNEIIGESALLEEDLSNVVTLWMCFEASISSRLRGV